MMKRYAVIPARYESSRFPGKPLALLNGKPVLRHVYERVLASELFDEVIIATDDLRISSVARILALLWCSLPRIYPVAQIASLRWQKCWSPIALS